MKKIIAAAVATAFVTPVMAADVTVGGSTDMTYTNADGGTTLTNDSTFTIAATQEFANGITASSDLNINGAAGNDGSNSLTLSGEFGKIDMGDTSSATDAIDDITDVGFAASSGTGAGDAGMLYTLPAIAPGLTLMLSHSPDTTPDSVTAGNGGALKYANGPVTFGYAEIDFDDKSSESLVNLKSSFAGVGVGYELRTTTTAAGVDTEIAALGLQYTTGPITLAIETVETESAGTVSEDLTAMMFHYEIDSGLVAYFETKEDDKTVDSDETFVGVKFSF
jgi:hypothetical protein